VGGWAPRFDSTYGGLKLTRPGEIAAPGRRFDSTYEGLKLATRIDAYREELQFRQYL